MLVPIAVVHLLRPTLFPSLFLLLTLVTTSSSSSNTILRENKDEPPFTCTDIIIPVTISTRNYVIPTIPDANGTVPTTPIRGTYEIGARYCEPGHRRHGKSHVLQILVHGITYTRNYWSGDGAPGQGFGGDEYSWIAYAASHGYTTLSIDCLGNGLSSHPDPVAIVQINAHVSVLHQLVRAARAGQLTGPAAGRKFKNVIYIGHSFGSISGNHYNAQYPADVDATILTGWGTQTNSVATNALLFPVLGSAAVVDSTKWGGLDAGYLTFNSSEVFTKLFYREEYCDPSLVSLDYKLRGTLALGEALSAAVEPLANASTYTGSVLVLTGQKDFVFCPPAANGTVDCGTGWASNLTVSRSLYPVAKSFASYALPNLGHCWNFHYGAREGFKIAHDWIEGLEL